MPDVAPLAIELRDDPRHLAREHDGGVLPPGLVVVGTPRVAAKGIDRQDAADPVGSVVLRLGSLLDVPFEGLALDDLERDEVEMDGVRVFRCVVDLPHLHVIEAGRLRDRLEPGK